MGNEIASRRSSSRNFGDGLTNGRRPEQDSSDSCATICHMIGILKRK